MYRGEVQGMRRHGRPRTTWKAKVREYMEKEGLDWEEVVVMTKAV